MCRFRDGSVTCAGDVSAGGTINEEMQLGIRPIKYVIYTECEEDGA